MQFLPMLIKIYNMSGLFADYQVGLLFSFWDICRLFCTVAIYGYQEQQKKLSLTKEVRIWMAIRNKFYSLLDSPKLL